MGFEIWLLCFFFFKLYLLLQKSSLESKPNGETEIDEAKNEVEEGEIENNCDENSEVYYDKKKSFFDSISCEATEKAKGRSNKPDWRAEKKLNRETFGVSGNNRRGYYRWEIFANISITFFQSP